MTHLLYMVALLLLVLSWDFTLQPHNGKHGICLKCRWKGRNRRNWRNISCLKLVENKSRCGTIPQSYGCVVCRLSCHSSSEWSRFPFLFAEENHWHTVCVCDVSLLSNVRAQVETVIARLSSHLNSPKDELYAITRFTDHLGLVHRRFPDKVVCVTVSQPSEGPTLDALEFRPVKPDSSMSHQRQAIRLHNRRKLRHRNMC